MFEYYSMYVYAPANWRYGPQKLAVRFFEVPLPDGGSDLRVHFSTPDNRGFIPLLIDLLTGQTLPWPSNRAPEEEPDGWEAAAHLAGCRAPLQECSVCRTIREVLAHRILAGLKRRES